jgi:hypothetical protein
MRIHKASPHASLRMTGRWWPSRFSNGKKRKAGPSTSRRCRSGFGRDDSFFPRTSAAEAALLGRRFATRVNSCPSRSKAKSRSKAADKSVRSTRAGSGSKAAGEGVRSTRAMPTKVDVHFRRLYVFYGACESGVGSKNCAATVAAFFVGGGDGVGMGRIP